MNLTRRALRAKIQKIIEGITSTENPTAFTGRGGKHFMENWDWFQGVALFGLYEYYRDSGDEAVLRYLTGWFDEHIAAGPPQKNINSMCPLLTLSYLYEETGEGKLSGALPGVG